MKRMEQEQTVFRDTGGTHGVALTTPEGTGFVVAEDVGRHNHTQQTNPFELLLGGPQREKIFLD
jgi:formate dehydrogenase assembly factor FdhD